MTVVRTDSTLAPRAGGTPQGPAAALRAPGGLGGLGRRAMRAARRLGADALGAARGTARSTARVAAILPALLAALACPGAHAAPATPGGPESGGPMADGGQNFELVKDAALSFLVQQTESLPGKVTISLVSAAPRGLTTCGALEPFVPPGVRLWGRAMVGVRCNGERPWTIYLQARIGVIGDYFVAARTLNPGDVVGGQDLEARHGDLTALPPTLVTNPSQVVGAILNNAVTAGFPLRSDMVRAALAIRYGQQVRVVARGPGFAVSSEGSALANAASGQPVRVRTPSGTIVSGIAQPDTTVEVPM